MGTNKTNSSLSEAEERISELEERMVETLKQGRIQQKRIKRNRYNLRDLWDNIKLPAFKYSGPDKREEFKKIFVKIIAENS